MRLVDYVQWTQAKTNPMWMCCSVQHSTDSAILAGCWLLFFLRLLFSFHSLFFFLSRLFEHSSIGTLHNISNWIRVAIQLNWYLQYTSCLQFYSFVFIPISFFLAIHCTDLCVCVVHRTKIGFYKTEKAFYSDCLLFFPYISLLNQANFLLVNVIS